MAEICILGCGVIGSSWIEAFLAGGHAVRVWDPAAKSLAAAQARYGTSISFFDDPGAAVNGADFVQESGPESLRIKHDLLQQIIGDVGSETIVASSTSTLRPSDIQAGLCFADRIIVGHPFNPPSILPLVEVIGGALTAGWVMDRAMCLYSDMGKRPIRLHLERSGHLANRLQAALWREAVDAVASGQATVEDVDIAVTQALGPRWTLLGPFATFDLAGGEKGLAHFLEHLGPAFEGLWDDANRPIVTDDLKHSLVSSLRAMFGGAFADRAAERDLRLREVLAIAHRPISDAERGMERGLSVSELLQ